MKKGTGVFPWTMMLTLLFWILLPVGSVFAVNTPTIIVSTPANNLVTGIPSVDIQGYVTDSATLEIDNVRVSTSPNGYFSYKKQFLANGANNIVLIARNSAGSTSNLITVIYDPVAISPTVVSTVPATVSTPTPNLTGSVSNNVYFYYTINGGPQINRPEVDSPFNFTLPSPLNIGDNTIVLTVTNGNRVVNQPIHIKYDAGGPAITNISPKDGDKVSTNKVVFTGIVTNPIAGGLKMFVNGAATGTVVSFNSSGNFQTGEVTLTPGANSIRFEATDGVATVSKTVNIRYEASPIIVITSPKDNDIVNRDSVVLSGKVFNTETNGLTVNNEPVSFGSDGTFAKSVNLDKIVNPIQVKAANGSLVSTAALTVYFSGIPRIDIASPSNGDTVNTADVIFRGRIFPIAGLRTFTIKDVNNINQISNGSFSSLPITLESGNNDIEFKLCTEGVTVPNGVYLPPRAITRSIKVISNIGPQITVSSPEDGGTVYSNTITVYGRITRADFDGVKVAGTNTKVNSDGSFSQTITLTNGKNDIKIEAKLGETNTSKTITVYYDAVAARSAVVRILMTDGGEAKAFNDMVKVKLTKGSVGLNTTSVLAMADQNDCKNIPSQSALVGPVISVGWNGEKPLSTYKVTLKYDDVVRDNQAHKVSVFYYDAGSQTWTVLGGIVDVKSKTVSVQTNRVGYFAAAIYYKTFDDLVNYWGQKDIEYLVARGAIPLNTTYQFHPDAYITRGEFVMFLVKAMGIQPYHPEISSYNDIEYGSDYYDYIEAALRAGLVFGISHDKFAPAQNITREEAAAVLARAGNMKPLKDPDIIKILNQFTDEKSISMWARNQLASAVKAKVLKGSADNTFKPLGKTTRAEAAAMIVRLSEILNKTTS